MKKIFLILSLVILSFSPLLLAGCKVKYSDLTIVVANQNLEIVLGEDDDTLESFVEVRGYENDKSARVTFLTDNEKLIILDSNYIGNGRTKVILKALAPGEARLNIKTLEGNKNAFINVSIIRPLNDYEFLFIEPLAIYIDKDLDPNLDGDVIADFTLDAKNLLCITPYDTSQVRRNFNFELKNSVSGVSIQNNHLIITDKCITKEFDITVTPINSDLPTKTKAVVLLPKFVASNDFSSATEGDVFLSKGNTFDNNSLIDEDGIEIIMNDRDNSLQTVILRVYTTKSVDAEFVHTDLIVSSFISKTIGLNFIDFCFSIRFADSMSSGTIEKVGIYLNYTNYNAEKIQVSETKITLDYIPKDISINNMFDVLEFDIYNFYTTEIRGLALNFSILPNAVSINKSKIVIKPLQDSQGLFSNIGFYQYYLGNLVKVSPNQDQIKINSNSTLYLKAVSTASGQFEFIVASDFDDNVYKTIKLNVIVGATHMDFDNKEVDPIYLQLNQNENENENNTFEIPFTLKSKNVLIDEIIVIDSDVFSVESISDGIISNENNTVTYSIKIKAKSIGSDKLTLYTQNGFVIEKQVIVFNTLERVNIDSDTIYNNHNIGQKTITSGNLSNISIVINNSVPLFINPYPLDGLYKTIITVTEVKESEESPDIFSSNEIKDIENKLINFNSIYINKAGKIQVKIEFIRKIMNEGSLGDSSGIETLEFTVEGFIPIRSFLVEKTTVSLYSYNTVGEYKRNLAETDIKLNVYPIDATFLKNLRVSISDKDACEATILKNDNNVPYAIRIFAKDKISNMVSVKLTIDEFGYKFSQTIRVYITDAITVEKIELQNVYNEIYIDNKTGINYFEISPTVYPSYATNLNIRYEFIDSNGNIVKIFTYENGRFKIPESMGFFGTVKIIAEDAFMLDSNGIMTIRSEVGNVVQFPIIIADGSSYETAIRIYNSEEFDKIELDKHYVLQASIILESNYTTKGDFSGGLYGLGITDEKDNIYSIKNITTPLFNEIKTGGIVGALNLFANFELTNESNGLVANINNGDIISVDVYGKFWFEGVGNIELGGIIYTNNANIFNCTFDAEILSGLINVGGIAYKNHGIISGCEVFTSGIGLVYEGINPELPPNLIPTNISTNFKEGVDRIITTNQVFLFYFKPIGNISITENDKINYLNTYSLGNLLDINIQANGENHYYINVNKFRFIITNEDNNIAEIDGTNIVLHNVGIFELKIISKYNPDVFIIVTINVIYPVFNFNIYKGNNAEDLSTVITNNSIMYLKYKTNQSIYANIESSRIVIDRKIEFVQNTVSMSYNYKDIENTDEDIFSDLSSNVSLGLFTIESDKLLDLDYELNTRELLFRANLSIQAGENNLNIGYQFFIYVYKGAQNIDTSLNYAEIDPMDVLTFDVILDSDFNYGEEEDEIVIKIFDENDEQTNIFAVVLSPSSEEGKFKVEISVNEPEKNEFSSGSYRIEISPNEDTFDFIKSPMAIVNVDLLDQKIRSVYYDHYNVLKEEEDSGNVVQRVDFEPTSIITAGKKGILVFDIYPAFSKIDHIEIISEINNGFYISTNLMDYDNVYTLHKTNYRVDINKILITNTSNYIKNGKIYLSTMIPTNILDDMIFQIRLKAYSSENDINPYEVIVDLHARYIPAATVILNNNLNSSFVGRATNNKLTIKVEENIDYGVSLMGITYTNNIIYTYNSIMLNYEEVKTEIIGNKRINNYTYNLYVGALFENDNSDDSKFIIKVTTTKVINNIQERKDVFYIVYVLDFYVKSISLIDTGSNETPESNANILTLPIFVSKKLEFSIDIEEPVPVNVLSVSNTERNAINALKFKITSFQNDTLRAQNLENDKYTKTLYYVSNNISNSAFDNNSSTYKNNNYISITEIKNVSNKYNFTSVTGKNTGSQSMLLEFVFRTNNISETTYYTPSLSFVIQVVNYSTEDIPILVYNTTDFMNMLAQEDSLDYILMDDIILEDYVINETNNIRSLDGNNKKIIIKSFYIPVTTVATVLDLSLFQTVSENTTIKNVMIDYGQLVISSTLLNNYTEINLAGLAISNDGIITNCHIFTQYDGNYLRGLVLPSNLSVNIEVSVAGLVLDNSGYISNSRVGGESFVTISNNGNTSTNNLNVFVICAYNNVAGFVLNNSGNISASYFSNGRIINQTVLYENSKTAGFVLENLVGGSIYGSYASGVKSQINEPRNLGFGIESSGIVAGFVYLNNASISDCYSNIKLYKQNISYEHGRNSAGFVYSNMSNGDIINCYSLSAIITGITGQSYFSGVNDSNTSLNNGNIAFSYYLSDNDIVEIYKTGAKALNMISTSELHLDFYGFSFTSFNLTNDGVWKNPNNGRAPELVSANQISYNVRYKPDNIETNLLVYVVGYEYGSDKNPIIIRNATEFNSVFTSSNDSSIKNYYENTTNKKAYGTYRLVSDIDFAYLVEDTNGTSNQSSNQKVKTTNFELTTVKDVNQNIIKSGIIDGNNMVIENVDLLSSTQSSLVSYGLFKSITGGAMIKNLNIKIINIESTAQYVGALTGILEDSKLVNITVSSMFGNTMSTVNGQNIVGGIVGVVKGNSVLNGLTASVSVNATYSTNSESNTAYNELGSNNNNGYAGGIAGAIQTKDLKDSNNIFVTEDTIPQAVSLKVGGRITIIGRNAGGIAGYVGKTTYIENAWFCIEETNQQIIARDKNGYAGGIAGICYGKLKFAKVEHNDKYNYYDTNSNSLQDRIEKAVEDYYNSPETISRLSNENLFASEYNPAGIGGLAGYANGAIIQVSYSKADVINLNADYAGGLIGLADINAAKIFQCYTFGAVRAKKVVEVSGELEKRSGGVVGRNRGNLDLHTVVAATYHKANMIEDDFGGVVGVNEGTVKVLQVYYINNQNRAGEGVYDAKPFLIKDIFPYETNTFFINTLFRAIDNYDNTDTTDPDVYSIVWDAKVFYSMEGKVFPFFNYGRERNVYYINNDENNPNKGLDNLINHPNKQFVIQGEVDLSTVGFSIFDRLNDAQFNFNGILMGEDKTTAKLTGLPDRFIGRATGAGFYDFGISFGTSTTPAGRPQFGFVGTANSSVFSQITVKDSILTVDNSTTSVGFLAGEMESGCVVNNVFFKDCRIKGGGNIGFITGTSTKGMTMSIENVDILEGIIEGSTTTINFNAGFYIGEVSQISVNYDSTDFDIVKNSDIKLVNETILTNVNAGLLFGTVKNNLTLTIGQSANITNSQISVGKITNTTMNLGAIAGSVGTTSGKITQTGTLKIGYKADADFPKKDLIAFDEGYKNEDGDINIGGVVGKTHEVWLESVELTQNIAIKNKTNLEFNSVHTGGMVGQATGASYISSCTYTGDISTYDAPIKSKKIYAGGIIGSTQSGTIGNEDNTKGNFANGDIYTLASEAIYLGGIAGQVNASIIKNNTTYVSLKNKNYTSQNNYFVNAIVGDTGKDSAVVNNTYCYLLSLAIDRDENNNVSYSSTKDGSAPSGSKFNPFSYTKTTTIANGKYYYLASGSALNSYRDITIENFTLLSDGGKIRNIESGFISTINGNTVIGGIVFENFTIAGGDSVIASTNNGYVIGCVTSGNLTTASTEGAEGSGFVNTNNGLIAYSNANVNVTSTATSSAGAGFVLNNSGIIDYCYSTGEVNTNTAYSFGNSLLPDNKNGIIMNSYTIGLIAKATTKNIFGGLNSNCGYDKIGTEATASGLKEILPKYEYKNENEVSVVLINIHSAWGFNNIEIKTGGLTTGYYNYGYPTLSDGAFNSSQSFGYLALNTNLNIINARMLAKIMEINHGGEYTLVRDINLNHYQATITGGNWIPIGQNISKSFIGNLNGNSKTISNLKILNYIQNYYHYGLFGYVSSNESQIYDLTLNNININVSISEDKLLFIGAVAGVGAFKKITNVRVTGKLFGENNSSGVYSSCLVGGLVGEFMPDLKYVEVNNCKVGNEDENLRIDIKSQSSYGKSYSGGLFGESNSLYGYKIKDCTVYANITYSNNSPIKKDINNLPENITAGVDVIDLFVGVKYVFSFEIYLNNNNLTYDSYFVGFPSNDITYENCNYNVNEKLNYKKYYTNYEYTTSFINGLDALVMQLYIYNDWESVDNLYKLNAGLYSIKFEKSNLLNGFEQLTDTTEIFAEGVLKT